MRILSQRSKIKVPEINLQPLQPHLTLYSMEYMMLFQTICSEIDVVGKAYAGICEPSFKADKRTGLNEYTFARFIGTA